MSNRPKVYLDFEFNRTLNEKVNLVSCVLSCDGITHFIWLYDSPEGQSFLKDILLGYQKRKAIFIAYSVVAEARSFYSLGLNPTEFSWVDLMLEYRCLTNHNEPYSYGKQLVGGRVVFTQKPLPKWQRVEITEEGDEDDNVATGFSPTHSLAEATYKLTGQIRDTKEKDEVRDLIIADKDLKKHRDRIEKYNKEDVNFLPELWKEMKNGFVKSGCPEDEIYSNAMLRGRYAALTALMESKGYPIDFEATKNFSEQVPNIMREVQQEINSLFPEVKPFVWNKNTQRYSIKESILRDWISNNCDTEYWMKTDTGRLSLSLEAWTRVFDFKHDYPKDNFGAQIVRFLKLKQNLYGFVPTIEKKRKTFWDYVGPDQRVRPYMNIYKAQSSRSQPAASGFMFLKPAWMRALVQPKPGMAMAGVDFGSQEFFLSGLLSGDKKMIDAYLSGDPYMAFGKDISWIPPEGTKKTHTSEREVLKSSVLGISFLMSKYGLSIKLSADTGKPYTEDEAQEIIDLFYGTYDVFAEWQKDLIYNYQNDKTPIRLYDGWYMWTDNDNFRSVANCGIQGTAAAIMREAVYLANKRGLYVPFTLHDALYIEFPVGEEEQVIVLQDCMREAFQDPFDGWVKDAAKNIRLDPLIWGPDYGFGEMEVKGKKIETKTFYLDKRGEKEYEQFKKYFEKPEGDYL